MPGAVPVEDAEAEPGGGGGVEAAEAMEAYDCDSAGSCAGSYEAEVAGAVEASPGGAEAGEGLLWFNLVRTPLQRRHLWCTRVHASLHSYSRGGV